MVNFADVEALLSTADSTEVVQEAKRESVALSAFNVVSMSKGKVKIPLVSVLPTAGWENGELGSESRRKPVSNWATKPKYLVAKPLATIVPIPEEVIEDSTFDIWAAIRTGISSAFAKMIDNAVLFGVNKPTEWTDDAIVPGAVAKGNIVYTANYKDIADQINGGFSLVEDDGYDVNTVLGPRSLRSKMRGLRDADGAPIFVDQLVNVPNTMPSILGAPFYPVTNGAWDKENYSAVVGNGQYVQIGVRKDMSFKILDQATLQSGGTTIHLGQEDALALRVTFRVAYAIFDPANPEATNGFPFAAVSTKANG